MYLKRARKFSRACFPQNLKKILKEKGINRLKLWLEKIKSREGKKEWTKGEKSSWFHLIQLGVWTKE